MSLLSSSPTGSKASKLHRGKVASRTAGKEDRAQVLYGLLDVYDGIRMRHAIWVRYTRCSESLEKTNYLKLFYSLQSDARIFTCKWSVRLMNPAASARLAETLDQNITSTATKNIDHSPTHIQARAKYLHNIQITMAPPDPDDKLKASTRTFNIVELAEKIFLALSFADVLKMQRVSKHTNQVIADSTLLQQKLHLAPMEGDEPKDLLPVLPQDMHFEYNPGEMRLQMILHVRRYIRASEPRTPDHWHNILLAQPPFFHATIRHFMAGRTLEIESSTGITLGDVDKVAQEMMTDYKRKAGRWRQEFNEVTVSGTELHALLGENETNSEDQWSASDDEFRFG